MKEGQAYENSELNVRSSKLRRHSVEYVVDKDLDSVEVGDTIPMVINYMGKSVTTYVEAVEDTYIEDNHTATNTPEPSNTPQPTATPEATNTPDVTQAPTSQPTTTPITTTATKTPTPDIINNHITTSDRVAKLKSIKLTSVMCKKGAKQIRGKVSVSGAAVKIKVGSKEYKKATVKGKKFTLKVPRLKKNTKVTIKVTKSGYKSLVKTYKVK